MAQLPDKIIADIYSNYMYSIFLSSSDYLNFPHLPPEANLDDIKNAICESIRVHKMMIDIFAVDVKYMRTASFIHKYRSHLPPVYKLVEGYAPQE